MKNRAKLVEVYTLEMDNIFSLMIKQNSCSGIDCFRCPFKSSNSVEGAYCTQKGNAKGCSFFIADIDKTDEMKELQKALREEHFKGKNKCMDCVNVTNCYQLDSSHPVEYEACKDFKGELDTVYSTTEKGYKYEARKMINILEDFYNSGETLVLGRNFIKGVVTLYSLNTGVTDVLEIDNPEDMSKLAKIGMSELNNVIECIASDVNGQFGRLEDCFNWRKKINDSTLVTELRKGSQIEFVCDVYEGVPF